jgi:ABC-type transport system involved in multi-copper enzyme maturation permease subunit
MKVWTIAKLSLLEYLRDRYIVLVLGIGLLLIFLAAFLSELTLDEVRRLYFHLGLLGIHLSLLFLSLMLGAFTLQKEVERQTCLLILAQPISRTQFLLGKAFGIGLLLALVWSGAGLFHYLFGGMDYPLLTYANIYFTLLIETFFVAGLALCFSTFARGVIALIGAVIIWLGGQWREDMLFFAKRGVESHFQDFVQFIHKILPPLNELNYRTLHVVDGGLPPHWYWVWTKVILMTALFLSLANLIWRRKDIL